MLISTITNNIYLGQKHTKPSLCELDYKIPTLRIHSRNCNIHNS